MSIDRFSGDGVSLEIEEHRKFFEKLRNSASGIQIPNNPEITSISNNPGFKLLSIKEQEELNQFMLLLKCCEVISQRMGRISYVEGIYRFERDFFIVWHESTDNIKEWDLYVRSISHREARKLLIKEIEELRMDCAGMDFLTEDPQTDAQSIDRKTEIEELISNRIKQTTLTKFSGWDAQARKSKVWELIEEFFEKNRKYPTDNEILGLEGMRHPHLKIGDLKIAVKKLLRDLENAKDKIPVPIDPLMGHEVTDEEILTFEAVQEICRTAELICPPLGQMFGQTELYKLDNLYFERVIINHLDDYESKHWTRIHYLRKTSKKEMENLRRQDDASTKELLGTLSYTLERYRQELKSSEDTLKRLDEDL